METSFCTNVLLMNHSKMYSQFKEMYLMLIELPPLNLPCPALFLFTHSLYKIVLTEEPLIFSIDTGP